MAAGISDESILRNLLDSFTDRERILAHFHQLLHSTQAGEFHLLAVKGNSGTGKTFLIEYLSKRICPQMGWQTGVLAFAQSFPDFRSILDGLEEALKRCVSRQSLKQYRVQREEYNRHFDEYRATITVNQHIEARDSSSVSHIQMNAHVNAELRRRELQLRAELTRALLELAEECEHPLGLFIDGYERLAETDPELVGWLWGEVLLKLPKSSPQPVLIVTCGWEYPMSAALQPFSTNGELDDFDQQRVKDYLQAQGIIPHDASEHDPLISAFYDLSRGHPLVLALAATYFQALPEPERTPENLRAKSPLITEEARVKWLEERLLKRLPEPYRTLLEHGPILRSFDQSALNVLLNIESDGKNTALELDDRAYARFLQYPFINRKNAQGDALLTQPIFHDLARKVRIDALRRLHPETKQRLHRAMAEYYKGLIEAEQQRSSTPQAKPSNKEYAEWFAEMPEQEFRALLEFLYHALQVKEMQAEAFDMWQNLVSRAVNRWRHKQAGPLLELVRQAVAEEEPFLEKQSDRYGQYLVWYSQFLGQEARRDDARIVLQEAVQVFEQRGDPSGQAVCLNNIGVTYGSQGQLDTALDYLLRALTFFEQVGNPVDIAQSFNNIGVTYDSQGQLDTALDYLLRALTFFEQVGNPAKIAQSFNNVGAIYRQQGQLDTALNYYERALSLREQVGNPADIAQSFNNIGVIYRQQGQLDAALNYYERALSLREQVSNPADIAQSFNNIGEIYRQQGQLERALDYHERALSLREQVGNPANIAQSLNNIGWIYHSQGQLEKALDYYKRALSLREQVGNPANIAQSLNNIGGIYHSQGQLDKALDYHKRALSLREQVENPADIALSCHNIAMLYQQQEQWQNAIPLFSRAVSLYERMGHGFESDVADELEGLALCYAKLEEIEKGAPYYMRAKQIREQLQKDQA